MQNQDIMYRFARPVPQLCIISNALLNILFSNWGHLLRTFQKKWLLQQHREHFVDMVYGKGGLSWQFLGFFDRTGRAISHPSIHQKVFYNVHKRYHALKFESAVASNDLIANLYGPAEGKRHDTGMLMDSASLRQFQQYSFGQNQLLLCIYGDSA